MGGIGTWLPASQSIYDGFRPLHIPLLQGAALDAFLVLSAQRGLPI